MATARKERPKNGSLVRPPARRGGWPRSVIPGLLAVVLIGWGGAVAAQAVQEIPFPTAPPQGVCMMGQCATDPAYAYCSLRDPDFRDCLASQAENVVRRDPAHPKATGAYEVRLTRATGEAHTTVVLMALDHPQGGDIDGVPFVLTVQALAPSDDEVQVTCAVASQPSTEAILRRGETTQVLLPQGQVTVHRL
jgi:hypothetical protein